MMIDESFSQRCSVGDSTPDYGYGDTNTTSTPDAATIDLGYGSTAPSNGGQYGYGDDSNNNNDHDQQQQEQQRRRERPRRRGSITKYSLDAQQEVQQEFQAQQPPAEAEDKDIHFDPTSMGYGLAVMAPNANPPTPTGKIRKSRKSDAAVDTTTNITDTSGGDKYGYGDTNDMGYGDTSGGTAASAGQQSADSQRHRPRRRGSITKYSLEATETVAKEYEDQVAPSPPPQQEYQEYSMPMSTEDTSHDGSDGDHDDDDGDAEDGKKKKKKGGRFSRLRLGRSLSHSSKGSKNSH
jgi:hypothetical protein